MMKKLKKNKGFSYPMTTVCLVVVLFVFMGILEIIRVNIMVGAIRDKYEDAIIYASTSQYAKLYQDVREGYAASYQNTNGSSWLQSNSASETLIRQYMQNAMTQGEIGQCTILDVDYHVTTAQLAPSDHDSADKFAIEGTLEVEVPYDFAWGNIAPMQFTINVKSQWRAKF